MPSWLMQEDDWGGMVQGFQEVTTTSGFLAGRGSVGWNNLLTKTTVDIMLHKPGIISAGKRRVVHLYFYT